MARQLQRGDPITHEGSNHIAARGLSPYSHIQSVRILYNLECIDEVQSVFHAISLPEANAKHIKYDNAKQQFDQMHGVITPAPMIVAGIYASKSTRDLYHPNRPFIVTMLQICVTTCK